MQGNAPTISKLVLAGVAAAYAVVMILVAPDAPTTQTDSASYLQFSSYRTATYPLFIKLVGLNGLTIAQTLLFAGALAVLGFKTLASTRNLAVAAILMVGVAANPELNKYHSVVMTESLFMSALLVFLAMLIRFVRRKDLLSLGLAAAFAGVAATIRPPGLALLPIPILMVLACRQQLKSRALALLAVALLPAIMLVAGERALSHVIHQGNVSSLAPRHIFAKAAMIDAPLASATESDPLRRALLVAIENDFAPIRALIAQADSNTRIPMTVHYESCVEYMCSAPLWSRNASPRFEAEMLRVGLQRLASAPLNYAGLVWTHYRALWTLYNHSHPATAPVSVAFIRSHRPLPFEDLVSPLVEDPAISRVASVGRPAILAVGWITAAIILLGAIAAFRGRLHDAAAVAWLSALAIHASFLFTAAVGVGIARYTVSMWPAMVTSLIFAAWFAVTLRRKAGG
jgi:hypothetical protein